MRTEGSEGGGVLFRSGQRLGCGHCPSFVFEEGLISLKDTKIAPGALFFSCSALQISASLKWYCELVSFENVFDILISHSGDGPTLQLSPAPTRMF